MSALWIAIGALASAALLLMVATAIGNALAFPRLGRARAARREAGAVPRVSVLVPAREEAARIAGTLRSLLDQEHDSFEVIVLDDRSSDGTSEVALETAAGDPRFRLLQGEPLAEGWMGKNWACHQLGRAARGELLVFTDADVRWQADALGDLEAELEASGSDVLTVWPTQRTESWGERLVVPLMAFSVLAYLPVGLVHRSPNPAFVAANGQCLAFRRAAYERVGGHAAVRGDIVEDMGLARAAKRAGLRLRAADAAGRLICRMYRGWPEVRDGYAKNLLAGFGGSIAALAAGTLFHWLVLLAPWVWLAVGTGTPGWPAWPVALIVAGVAARAITAAATRQRIGDALLLPVSVLLMTRIAARSVAWGLSSSGPRWKGRAYRVEGERVHVTDPRGRSEARGAEVGR